MSLRNFILFKIEEMGKEMNDEIVYLCISQSYHHGHLKDLKKNINDFRACWKAIKSGHDVRGMVSILSARIDKTRDHMKMKPKLGEMLNYIDDFDGELNGEELANVPWENIVPLR